MTDEQQELKTLVPPTPIPPAGMAIPEQVKRRNDFTVGFGAGLVIFVFALAGMIVLNLLLEIGVEPLHFFGGMGLAMAAVCVYGFIRRKPLIALGVLAFIGLFVVVLGASFLLAIFLRN